MNVICGLFESTDSPQTKLLHAYNKVSPKKSIIRDIITIPKCLMLRTIINGHHCYIITQIDNDRSKTKLIDMVFLRGLEIRIIS